MDIYNPRDIRQVGCHVTRGTFWAAYVAPTDPSRETVCALDTRSGLDALHIELCDTGMKPRRKPACEAEPSPRWGYACRLPWRRGYAPAR